jgi:hypothetical protein
MNFCPISTNPPVAFANQVTASGLNELTEDTDTPANSISRPFLVMY